MAGLAFYALIGLLLLVPLELAFLVIAAALMRRRELAPRLAEFSRVKERYGWEGLLKLPAESKPSRRNNYLIAVIIILLLLLVVAVPGWFLVSPSLKLNLSDESFRQASDGGNLTLPPVRVVNETAGSLFSNLTFPRLNLTAPSVNISGVLSPLKENIRAVAFGLAAILIAVLVLVFVVARRKPAAETVEKAIPKNGAKKKAEAAKNGKAPQEAVRSPLLVALKARKYLVAEVVLLLLVVVALIAYLLRGRISGLFGGRLLAFAVSAKEFAVSYRFYILAGMVILAVIIFLLRRFAKSRQEPA